MQPKEHACFSLAPGMSLYIGYMVRRHCSPKWMLRFKLVKVMQMGAFQFCEVRKAKPSSAARTFAPAPPTQINSMWIYGFMVKTLLATQRHIYTAEKAFGEMGLLTQQFITQ